MENLRKVVLHETLIVYFCLIHIRFMKQTWT